MFSQANLVFPRVPGNTSGYARQSERTTMVGEDEGRKRAREKVSDEMVRQELGPYELARKADVDPATVSDFLAGKRWPQPGTRNKISVAIGWSPESIDVLARGGDLILSVPETVGGDDQDAGVLASLPPEALEGLDAAERAEVIAAAKLSALQTAREIRRRLDK